MGHADHCCERTEGQHGSNCLNCFTLSSPEYRASIASRALLELKDPRAPADVMHVYTIEYEARGWVVPRLGDLFVQCTFYHTGNTGSDR